MGGPSGAPLLVTGAAGFIGARFAASCLERGIPFVAVDRASHFAERPEHAGIVWPKIVDRDALFDPQMGHAQERRRRDQQLFRDEAEFRRVGTIHGLSAALKLSTAPPPPRSKG